MKISTVKISVSIIIILAGLLACTAGTPPSVPGEIEPAPPPEIAPTATLESSPPPESGSAGSLEFTETDPCKLVTREMAESAMGQSVDEPIMAQDSSIASCTYIAVPGEKMVMATVLTGENAKNNMLDEIAQLQQGCELHYRGTTRQEESTPLPPDVETLRNQSILELFLMDRELQAACGAPYSQLPELGENAYTFQSIFVGAVIGVPTEDMLVSFLVGDISMTPEQALEAAIYLVRQAASP